jgi:dCTP deaminase
MILSYTDLRREVQNKMVQPVSDAQVNASSIDVTLANVVKREIPRPDIPEDEVWVLSLGEREPMTLEEVDITAEPLVLMPGEFVLAATAEVFNLPLDVSAEFRLKSSAARMGLSHALAVWCDPGWNGSRLTLELHNISRFHGIALKAGDRIGQMIFHRHTKVPPSASYAVRGSYNGDAEASPAKPARERG